jgi:hypothetical protein
MSKPIALATVVLGLAVCPVAATTPVHDWSKRFSHEDSYGYRMILSDLASDASGNVIIVGTFGGTVDFGGGPLVSGTGDEDMFVAKFNAAGGHVWSRRIGGSSMESPNTVAVDGGGNITISGGFRGTVDFGGAVLMNPEDSDVFIARLDADGQTLWARSFPVPGHQHAFGLSVTSDHTLVACRLDEGIDFGGGYLDAIGGVNVFVARLDDAGNHVWSRRFAGTSHEMYPKNGVLRASESGEFYLAGSFEASLDFGTGVLMSTGGRDIYVAKFTADGTCLWSKRFGDTSDQDVSGAAVDEVGSLVIAGTFNGSLDVGGGALVSAGGKDMFLAKLGGAGGHTWSRRFGDAVDDYPGRVVLDNSGNLAMAGTRTRTIDFGGGEMVPTDVDVYLVHFDPLGTYASGHLYVGPGYQFETACAAGPDGSIVIGGMFQGSVDFGGGPLSVNDDADDLWNEDLFLVRFVPQQSTDVNAPELPVTLRQNYPNPFNPTTTIEYSLGRTTDVVIEIFNVAGERVALLDEGTRSPGTHGAVWNGRDGSGRPARSGVYFYRLAGMTGWSARKMVLLK